MRIQALALSSLIIFSTILPGCGRRLPSSTDTQNNDQGSEAPAEPSPVDEDADLKNRAQAAWNVMDSNQDSSVEKLEMAAFIYVVVENSNVAAPAVTTPVESARVRQMHRVIRTLSQPRHLRRKSQPLRRRNRVRRMTEDQKPIDEALMKAAMAEADRFFGIHDLDKDDLLTYEEFEAGFLIEVKKSPAVDASSRNFLARRLRRALLQGR